MVFFDRFLGAYRGFLNPKAATLLAPPEWLKEAFGWRESTAGISFSDRAAIQTSAVFAAIRIISQTCGSLPLPIFRRLERGKERLPNHRLRLLLNEQPNPDMPAMVFREALTAHAVSWGNGYAEIRRDMTGRARELWPLAPDRVTPEREGDEFMRARGATPGQEPAQIVYRVKNEGLEDSFLPARDVLHIPGLGWDGVQGYSVIAFARESIGLNMAAERFGAAFFGNGTHASGVVEMDGHFKDDSAIQRFRRNWQEKNAGELLSKVVFWQLIQAAA